MHRSLRIAIVGCFLSGAVLAADGFVELLNGKDLSGFKTTGNWVYEDDGSLALKPREGESGWQRYGAYLWVDKVYEDFELDLEFKYPPKGNSGVFIRVENLESPVDQGTEIQLLDCYGMEKELGHHDMGGIIRTQGPTQNASIPPGEWNRMIVTCKGMHLTVKLNGKTVQDTDLSKASKAFAAKGYVGIQDHGQPFWVRNIRIKEL